MKRLLVPFLIAVAGLYLLVLVIFFAAQRSLLYQIPPPTPEKSFARGTLVDIPKGERHVFVRWLPGPPGHETIVHFHGNAEQLSSLDAIAGAENDAGFGFYGIEYPGYGRSADAAASEAGIYAAADTALRYLREKLGVAASSTVLQGQSLGTGVAAEMALRGHGARLILISPYTSIPDLGQRIYSYLPVQLLARDRFDTLRKAPRISIPVLILHGDRDEIMPVEMARRLSRAFPRAELRIVPNRHHNDMLGENLPAVVSCVHGFVQGTGCSPDTFSPPASSPSSRGSP